MGAVSSRPIVGAFVDAVASRPVVALVFFSLVPLSGVGMTCSQRVPL